MHPFYGFKLGAKKEVAERVFGEFDHTRKVDDPPLVIQYYKNKNYSIEIDTRGNIYGIQIFGNVQRTKPKESSPSLTGFRKAILSRNIDSLLTYLAPDVELYHRGKVITYNGAARAEFTKNDSELVKHLLAPTESMWFVFAKEMAEGAPDVRIDNEAKTETHYYKFFDSNIISEIVFIPHAGKWKVYEIRFRNSSILTEGTR
jgi:hypothetical protein